MKLPPPPPSIFTHVPVLVPTNYKGGVGKTLTGRVAGQAMTEMPTFHRGRPVLFIDLDPQGNTSRRYRLLKVLPDGISVPIDHPHLEQGESSSVCDLWLNILTGNEDLAPEPYPTADPMIHVIPAHEMLMGKAMRMDEDRAGILGTNLRKWLRQPGLVEKYCCVIIDTQPSKTNLIDAALKAATHAYIPFNPEPQSIEGLYSIISYIFAQRDLRGNDVPLHMIGLLPNDVLRTTLHSIHMKALRDHKTFSKFLMPVKLNHRIAYAETDDWRNRPDNVTTAKGSTIEREARKYAEYLVKRILEDAA
jgi:chromosome partitioning protein